MSEKNVAIAGVTGAVGQELLRVLEARHFPVKNLKCLASRRSVGKKVTFKGEELTVEELTDKSFDGVEIALFSAGSSRSKQFLDSVKASGAVMVDNSSAFRMTEGVPLVVPEVNPDDVKKHDGVIANPNCSTIIMNVPVYPLHKRWNLKRVVCSTYQAASGAGAKAMAELEEQVRECIAGKEPTKDAFKHQIAFNLFNHDSPIGPNGYCEEEMKMVNETRKIFHADGINITATCVRVPVLRAHAESINLEFEQEVDEDEAREILRNAPGVVVQDDREGHRFPMPIEASGKDEVFVGRIRKDISRTDGRGLDLFVVGDQILKGAALNAVQIAELL